MGALSTAWLGCLFAIAAIWTCERNGVQEFSDRPCRGADGESVPLEPLNVVSIPSARDEPAPREVSTERTIAQSPPSERSSQPSARRAEPASERNDSACEAAQARLDAVRDQRRRGSKLKDEPKLIAAAEALTRDIRRYC
jgi:hypothetical protein